MSQVKLSPRQAPSSIDFAREIEPILVERCIELPRRGEP